MSIAPIPKTYPARLEYAAAGGRFVIVCEHASNVFPAEFGMLGLTEAQRSAHIAYDPGALGLARGLAGRLDGVLAASDVSRLIYDCNRPPDSAGAMAARSEIHDIPGNIGLSPQARAARVAQIYLPFHDTLRAEIARRIVLGLEPVIVTIHSFTPVFHGQARVVEFGVIHDADARFAQAVMNAADTALHTRLNEPYSAADGVTHTLRVQALPYGLPNVMLEIRNDLLTTPADQARIADLLAPVLAKALDAIAEFQ